MYNKVFYALMAGVMVLAVACNKDNNNGNNQEQGEGQANIKISEASEALITEGYSTDENADSFNIEFTAKQAWAISAEQTKAPATWISFNPSSGPAGPAKVTVAIAANSSLVEKQAVIKITSGNSVKSITVRQAAPPAVPAVKASYNDFLGDWIVTGTEHQYFAQWDERTEVYTFSYAVQIIENEKDKSYLIENWETGATADDRKYLYYGSEKYAQETGGRSIYNYFKDVVGKYVGIVAWYDADNGTMHIDRQTFYTDPVNSYYTVEFLGSSQTKDGSERPLPRGSFASDLKTETTAGTLKNYTICDFVKLQDGSVRIQAHPQTSPDFADSEIVFMGYCKYLGWYPNPLYYNTQFALPYSMKKP